MEMYGLRGPSTTTTTPVKQSKCLSVNLFHETSHPLMNKDKIMEINGVREPSTTTTSVKKVQCLSVNPAVKTGVGMRGNPTKGGHLVYQALVNENVFLA